jgi:hypothetical protein
VTEIGIHDDDKVARCELETVYICSPETELACASAELDAAGVGFLELFCDVLGAIGRCIVNDDDFPIEVAKEMDVSSNLKSLLKFFSFLLTAL